MTTTGPNNPGTVAQTSSGKATWSNLTNVTASDNAYATVSVLGSSFTTETLKITNFGFSVTGTVVGITAEIERNSTTNSSTTAKDSAVQLTKDGSTAVGSNKASASAWPSSDAYATYGGAADLWGTTWSAAEINSANFGLLLTLTGNSGFGNPVASVDHVRITVETTVGVWRQTRNLLGVGI